MATYREVSIQHWQAQGPSREEIQLGCLQRIADAAELMAVNYVQLQAEVQSLKRNVAKLEQQRQALKASNASLRGVITRLRGQLARGGT